MLLTLRSSASCNRYRKELSQNRGDISTWWNFESVALSYNTPAYIPSMWVSLLTVWVFNDSPTANQSSLLTHPTNQSVLGLLEKNDKECVTPMTSFFNHKLLHSQKFTSDQQNSISFGKKKLSKLFKESLWSVFLLW